MVKVIQIGVGGFDHNFSYLVHSGASDSKEAALIDPTGNLGVIETELERHKVKVVLQLFTHLHPDHVELLGHFKSKGVAAFKPKPGPLGKIEEISAAGLEIRAIHTPGHTKDSVCFLIENNFFSGDTIFVKGVGTTFYGGDEAELNKTLLFLSTLDTNLTLWPGHKYGGASSSLGAALKNSHFTPSASVLDEIHKKVAQYGADFHKKRH